MLVVGAGGQGCVVADALLQAHAAGGPAVIGFLDANRHLHGQTRLGLPVVGGMDALHRVDHDGLVVAIGDNAVRRDVTLSIDMDPRRLVVVCHPSSIVASDVVIGEGTMVSAAATIVTGARVGRGCIVNTGCVIDHDGVIGDWAHVAPRAVLGGQVVVGAGALVGIGAVVMPGCTIGERAVVGAGAVVTADVPARAVVVGIPAKVRATRP